MCYIYKGKSRGRAVLVTEASTDYSGDSSRVDEADYQFQGQAISFTVHRSAKAARYLQGLTEAKRTTKAQKWNEKMDRSVSH